MNKTLKRKHHETQPEQQLHEQDKRCNGSHGLFNQTKKQKKATSTNTIPPYNNELSLLLEFSKSIQDDEESLLLGLSGSYKQTIKKI